MATLDSPPPISLTAQTPTSIQPGGGRCMSLELAWGRLRRGWLRRFRPGYVQKMLSRRLGDCPQCPHDIIDSRDLKFYRNVCGFHFRPEDDPVRWRNAIPLARAGLAEVVCFSLVFLVASVLFALLTATVHWLFALPLAVSLLLWAFVLSFFRDPQRPIPTDPQALLSPADGTVTDVGEVEAPDFPGGRAFRISIFLSVFNVHVNRVPRSSRVISVRYFPGAFLDARDRHCAVRNEQLWVDLAELDSQRPIRVKQISGAIARRIVCWLKPGEEISAGSRFGMIKFGSRTDILVPVDARMEVRTRVGDQVRGGQTILLRFP